MPSVKLSSGLHLVVFDSIGGWFVSLCGEEGPILKASNGPLNTGSWPTKAEAIADMHALALADAAHGIF